MLVFIDDSGDPGFNFDKGSTQYFVIACIVFKDELQSEKAAVAIKDFKRFMNFPDSVELKFNKSSKKVREKFLTAINPFEYKIRCLVIDKTIIRSSELKNNKNSFYSYAIKLILQNSNNTILDAKVRIDGSGDRNFRKNFLTYLRKELNSKQKKVIRNCKLIDSKYNVLIQMVDMIAGSIRRSYETVKTDSKIYKQIIKKHVEDEWQFR